MGYSTKYKGRWIISKYQSSYGFHACKKMFKAQAVSQIFKTGDCGGGGGTMMLSGPFLRGASCRLVSQGSLFLYALSFYVALVKNYKHFFVETVAQRKNSGLTNAFSDM